MRCVLSNKEDTYEEPQPHTGVLCPDGGGCMEKYESVQHLVGSVKVLVEASESEEELKEYEARHVTVQGDAAAKRAVGTV